MPRLQLHIQPDAYELRLDGELVARLDGGARALLRDTTPALREADIEAAIERTEDWLMPVVRRLQSLELRVHDATGRSRALLGGPSGLTTEQVEAEFTRVHDAVVRGQASDRGRVADVVLLRELAHHAALSRIVPD